MRSAPSSDALASFDESAEDLLENAPCGYISAAPDGLLVRVNGTFLRWTGYTREQLVGVKRFQDLLSVGARIYHETHYAPMLRMQGIVREIAVEIVTADGGRLPTLVNSVLVRDDAGAPQIVRTTIFDATERQGYERELKAARDRERMARERTERLQRITARLAAAPDARAIAAAVVDELTAAPGVERAGVGIVDPPTGTLEVLAGVPEPGPGGSGPRFDDGGAGRPASAQLPLGGGTAGWMWLELVPDRGFGAEDRAVLEASAAQAGVALERSRLYEETRTVATSLQASLLADAPPEDARFEVSTLYHSAVAHLEVGGDWHDAFRLPGDRLGIVVGDVVGRGLRAASAMGQLRSAVRALAAARLSPAEVLQHLDTFVEEVDAARYATVAYAEVDPATGAVVLASAGHLPAIAVTPDGEPSLVLEGRTLPIGVTGSGIARTQTRLALAHGAGFLLYTDGLVERRSESIDVGLERILAAVRASPGTAPGQLVEELPRALLEHGDPGDDVCLLSFRRR